MKKIIKILIVFLTIVLIALIGTFAFLYFRTDKMKSNKQVYLKYLAESGDFIYNQIKDEDLDTYKNKLKNTPYQNNGKIAISYDTEDSNKSKKMQLMENSNISITGKVDKANKINSQNIKINFPQNQTTDIDLIAQDDLYGFRINNILKSYISVENNNLQEWAKVLGLNEEQLKLIPNKLDGNFIDSIVTDKEMNEIIDKYKKQLFNSLNNDMFSATTQDKTTVYSLKITESQLKEIVANMLQEMQEDEEIWKIVKNILTRFSNYSEEELEEVIKTAKENLKKSVEDEINPNNNNSNDDVFGNFTTNSSASEDSLVADEIYQYNLYITDKKLEKIESITETKTQTISKTEKGILIESNKKGTLNGENNTTVSIEKTKEEEKLIYNIKIKGNSQEIMSFTIGYNGLRSLQQVQEVATLDYNLDLESEKGILKKAEENRKKNISSNEESEIMLSISEILTQKITNKYTTNNTNADTSITLNDLKQKFKDKNFDFFENTDGTFKIISKDTNNEYTVDSSGRVETKEAEIQKSIETTTPKRKIQYYNKNTFDENLSINKIENSEIWKVNGKGTEQIGSVFESIFKKTEEINKEQNKQIGLSENETLYDVYMLGAIPYFSMVAIDNIEYEQITVRNVATAYIGTFTGLMNARNVLSFNNALRSVNSLNNEGFGQEMNRENSR